MADDHTSPSPSEGTSDIEARLRDALASRAGADPVEPADWGDVRRAVGIRDAPAPTGARGRGRTGARSSGRCRRVLRRGGGLDQGPWRHDRQRRARHPAPRSHRDGPGHWRRRRGVGHHVPECFGCSHEHVVGQCVQRHRLGHPSLHPDYQRRRDDPRLPERADQCVVPGDAHPASGSGGGSSSGSVGSSASSGAVGSPSTTLAPGSASMPLVPTRPDTTVELSDGDAVGQGAMFASQCVCLPPGAAPGVRGAVPWVRTIGIEHQRRRRQAQQRAGHHAPTTHRSGHHRPGEHDDDDPQLARPAAGSSPRGPSAWPRVTRCGGWRSKWAAT